MFSKVFLFPDGWFFRPCLSAKIRQITIPVESVANPAKPFSLLQPNF
jgi:hypothetical protein